MSKKFSMFFLAVVVVLFAVSSAMADTYYAIRPVVDDTETESIQDITLYEDDSEESYAGYNYKVRYRLPEVELCVGNDTNSDDIDTWTSLKDTVFYEISWDMISVSDDLKIKEFTSDTSSDIMVISGLLPEAEADYNYQFRIVAQVVSVEPARIAALGVSSDSDVLDDELEISVEVDSEHTAIVESSFDEYVIATDPNNATSDYEVIVTVSSDYDADIFRYANYIESDDDFVINLPEWLTYTVTGTYDDVVGDDFLEAPVTSVVIRFNTAYGEVPDDGTKARIYVPFVNFENDTSLLISWDVTFVNPLTISGTKTLNFSLEPGTASEQSIAFTGNVPVEYTSSNEDEISKDLTITVSPNYNFDNKNKTGKITVIVEALDEAASGDYATTLTFTDAKGNEDNLEIKVTVDIPVPEPGTFTITGTKTLSVTAGSSAKTTLTASGDISGDVTWTAGSVSPSADISITINASSDDNSAEVTATAGSSVSAGTYSVTVKAVDEEEVSADAELKIVVTAPTPPDPVNPSGDVNPEDITDSITITTDSGDSASSKPLSSLVPGDSAVFKISLEGTGITAKIWTLRINGVVSDTVNASVSGFFVSASSWAEITESNQTSATIKAAPPANLSTDSNVTILITDTNDKEYVADLGTVKANSSSEDDGSLGSSSSGCNAGFGTLALAIAALSLFYGRKY